MFSGCTSLESAPELSATTLAENCYRYMFYNCTSLTSAPELSAKELAEGCYSNMFSGCTSLTSAPELSATTLADYCYESMFYGCSSLSSVTMLAPNDQITENRFTDWLADAGTDGNITRTLILTDQNAYKELANKSIYLPDNWKIGSEGTTVQDALGNAITE